MRIRRSTPSSLSHPPSPSSCSSSSSSSCFSSSTHSTISTHSLTSSSNSTSSSLSLSPTRRCEGLDLLVKAVYHVAGSVVGVPYIQRRVIRRRKRAVRFTNLVINTREIEAEVEDEDDVEDEDEEEEGEVFDSSVLDEQKKKQRKRSMAIPSKYQDSVLQSWKPRDRRRRRSSSKV